MNREMSLLEEAQRLLSTERHSNMAIYIKIAAMLPHKTVRDVAYKFMELNTRVSVFFYVKIMYIILSSGMGCHFLSTPYIVYIHNQVVFIH